MKAFDASIQAHVASLEQRIFLLRQTLQGLATNATQCKACALHNEIYADALARDDRLATGTPDTAAQRS